MMELLLDCSVRIYINYAARLAAAEMDSSTRVGIQEGEYAPPDATGQFPLEDLAGDRKRVAFTAKHAECLVSFIDVIPGGAHPPETDTIDPDIDARAGDCEKGKHIASDPCQHAHHGPLANPHELMDGHMPGEDRSRADMNMSTQQCAIHQCHVIFHRAVMPHMAANHQQTALTDTRRRTGCRTAMNRHVFTHYGAVTDLTAAEFSGVGPILRNIPNDDPCVDLALSTNCGVLQNMTHGGDNRMWSDPDA